VDRLVSVLVVLGLGGCSLSISAPAANRKKYQVPECDTGKGFVAIDALAAVGFGIGGLAALSEEQGTGAIALVGAALFTAAALHGSSNADKCREAYADYTKEANSIAPQVEEIVRRPRKRPRKVEPEPEPDEEPDPIDATDVPQPATDLASRKPSEVGTAPAKPEPRPDPPLPKRSRDDWSQFWREVP
jgi:hypothetical protein